MLGKSSGKEVPAKPAESAGTGARNLSVISSGMRVEGNCTTHGYVRIEGAVVGNVVAAGVELAQSGSVDGDIHLIEGADVGRAFLIGGRVNGTVRATHVEVQKSGHVDNGVVADEAVIQGHVRGGVLARKRLALEESAIVEGDVRADRLSLKEGGRVNGTIRMGELTEKDALPSARPIKVVSDPGAEVKEGAPAARVAAGGGA